MTAFGRDDPREMPPHFFYRSVRMDYSSAVRADTERQNCSICPRYWYVDTVFPCERCGDEFTFTAEEQRVWYEEYAFWIDSLPKHCPSCRRALRELKAARQEYDRMVEEALRAGDLEPKKRLAQLIDQLYELGGELPPRINANRKRLAREIAKAEEGAG
ncbi:MAG: zinc-ribbon domain containing protein [Acidobacteriota bacterium]